MNDETLNVVLVISSARNTPDVERIADDRIATGARERAEFEQQHEKNQHHREHQHDREIAERFLLFPIRAAVLHANGRRQLQIGDGFLHRRDAGAEIHAFQPRGHFDLALQILAAHFGLARKLFDRGQRIRAWPFRRTSSRASVLLIASSDARSDAGKRTRSV